MDILSQNHVLLMVRLSGGQQENSFQRQGNLSSSLKLQVEIHTHNPQASFVNTLLYTWVGWRIEVLRRTKGAMLGIAVAR